MNQPLSIAIDGPSGAGKSTLAKELARVLGFLYIDTGALYRTVAYACFKQGIDSSDKKRVIASLPSFSIGIEHHDGIQHTCLDGIDVSGLIRTPEMSMGASAVSAIPEVRAFLFNLQRSFAETENVVMDGRDVGTTILPNATVKIYLTSSVENRAYRRYQEHISRGEPCTFGQIYKEIEQRDYNDMHRLISPLTKAEDAVVLDNSDFPFEVTLCHALQIIKSKTGELFT